MKRAIRLACAAAVAASVGGASQAAVIDFTDATLFPVGTEGVLTGPQGGGWTLTGFNKSASIIEEGDAACPAESAGVLMCGNDGIGIGASNDEITAGKTLMQYVVITFEKAVKLTAFYTLDTFLDPSIDDLGEIAYVGIGTMPDVAIGGTAFAVAGSVSGFASATGLSLKGSSFTFWTTSDRLDDNTADFALAGIDIAPVPLPAGLLLMGTALGGLGLVARRRKARS